MKQVTRRALLGSLIGAAALSAGGATAVKSDDLAPLLAGIGRPTPGKRIAYWRFGTVVEWDGLNGTNKINVGGTVLEDVPSLAGTGALLLAPGDTAVLGVHDTTVFVLGSVRSGPNFQFPIVAAPLAPSYGVVSSWPSTSSTSYVEAFRAFPEVVSPAFLVYVLTSVPSGVTAQFRTIVTPIGGTSVVVDESTVFVEGQGFYAPVIPWPSTVGQGAQPAVTVEMKKLSGTGSVSASGVSVFAD